MEAGLAFIRAPIFLQSESRCRSKKCKRIPGNRSIASACTNGESVPKVWVCTGSTCRGNSLLSTLRALVSNAGATIEATGCVGECGNGPNVAVETCDSVQVCIEKHIDSLERAVGLLERLKFDIDDEMVRVAGEKEKGDVHMVKGNVGCAGEHYEKAIDLMSGSEWWSSARSVQLRIGIMCNWAQSLVKSSNHEKALSLVNEVIDAQADCVTAWKWKALAHEGKREFDMAKKSWETWGKLSGKAKEAKEYIARFTGWRAWLLSVNN